MPKEDGEGSKYNQRTILTRNDRDLFAEYGHYWYYAYKNLHI